MTALADRPSTTTTSVTLAGQRRRPHRVIGIVGGVTLGAFVVVAVIGPWIAPYTAAERPTVPFSRPSADRRLGTAALALAIGSLVGALAGARRGWTDIVAMRTVDVVLALPFIPLLIVAATFAGRGLVTQVVLIAALTWARPARLIRSAVFEARSRGHVEVAEGMGASRWRLLWRHLSVGAALLGRVPDPAADELQHRQIETRLNRLRSRPPPCNVAQIHQQPLQQCWRVCFAKEPRRSGDRFSRIAPPPQRRQTVGRGEKRHDIGSEGLERGEQARPERSCPGDRPGLEQRRALPGAPPLQVVLAHRIFECELGVAELFDNDRIAIGNVVVS